MVNTINFFSAEQRKELKDRQLHRRRFAENVRRVGLNSPSLELERLDERASVREFARSPISSTELLELLRASPKGLSLCIYVYVKERAVTGLQSGLYSMHEAAHTLVRVSAGESINRSSQFFYNRPIFDECSFCIYLVAANGSSTDGTLSAARLEAGRIGQSLMQRQQSLGIGLCPIGEMDFERIRADFRTSPHSSLVHCLLGGARRAASVVEDQPALGIAIVGLSARLPGVDNLAGFWKDLLLARRESIRPWPASRQAPSGRTVARPGGYLEGIAGFDSRLFGIAPVEATAMDPQERILLELVWECLEDAGYTRESLRRSAPRVGVFVGVMWNDYQNLHRDNLPVQPAWVSGFHSIANRISHCFDLQGPSLAIDTSCSSGLAALYTACNSLRVGDCDAAIVAAVNLLADTAHYDLLESLGLLSKAGFSSAFSANGDGWVPGEGAGAILIRPHRDAVRNSDDIRASIKGSVVLHSGGARRFGMADPSRQAAAIRELLSASSVPATSVSYVELSAAGAPIADARELEAVHLALAQDADVSWSCPVGSVKPNLGHAEASSFISQLCKVLAQMQHRMLAPTLLNGPLNPLLQLDGKPLFLCTAARPWDVDAGVPRRALISTVGATGTAGYVLLEEPATTSHTEVQVRAQVFVLSARTQPQLQATARHMLEYLQVRMPAVSSGTLARIAHTLQIGREPMSERLAIVAASLADLVIKLRRWLDDGVGDADVLYGTVVSNPASQRQLAPENCHEAAQLWVSGELIEWRNDAGIRKIALPTHPFERRHFWITPRDAATKVPSASDSMHTTRAPRRRAVEIENYLIEQYSSIAELPRNEIDASSRLEDLGINSYIVAALSAAVARDLRVPVTPSIFFEYRTLRDLAQHCAQLARTDVAEGGATTVLKQKARFEPIAIIGMAGRFPGAATLDDLWENLLIAKDSIEPIPAQRWSSSQLADISKWGGFISDVDRFDCQFFSIAPREAQLMDPQERIFLETAWHAIESAGYTRSSLANRTVGVYVGATFSEYQLLAGGAGPHGQAVLGSIANRISHVMDFRGPSMAIDTLCSSSLAAIHQACSALGKYEVNYALAGGVNLSLHPRKYQILARGGFTSSDGRCRSFGQGGDGYVPGEGVAALLLKRLPDALRDGDRIEAVIIGGAINHGGRTNGYTVPDPNAQSAVIRAALESGRIDPHSVTYIEAHGTGTALGDPIEVDGLVRAYGTAGSERRVPIGSIKSNMGHLEAAAGVAGLIKTVLQLQKHRIVASLHSAVLNPNVDWPSTGFYVPQQAMPWPPHADGELMPLRAGVSSFGAGGVNVHVVLQQAPACDAQIAEPSAPASAQLIVLSARTAEAAAACARRLLEFCTKLISSTTEATVALSDIAYTLQVGREPLRVRLAIVVESIEGLVDALREFIEHPPGRWYTGTTPATSSSERVAAEASAVPTTSAELQRFAARWVTGEPIRWSSLRSQPGKKISLPGYPFDHSVVHWVDHEAGGLDMVAAATSQPGEAVLVRSLGWERIRQGDLQPWVPAVTWLFGTHEPLWVELQRTLALHTRLLRIVPGSGFRQLDFDRYEFDAQSQSGIEELASQLASVGLSPQCALFVAPLHENEETVRGPEALLLPIHMLVRARLLGYMDSLSRVICCYACVPTVAACSAAAIGAYAKSVNREQDVVFLQVLGFAGPIQDSAWLARQIAYEVLEGSGHEEMRISEQDRCVPVLSPCTLPAEKVALRRGGLYVISGGLGGIGTVLARRLLQLEARVCLLGRQSAESRRRDLEKLRVGDGWVRYFQVDVRDQEAVTKLLEDLRSAHGPICGVLHLAGVIDDQLAVYMDAPKIGAVIGAKVIGAQTLDRATANDPLDFFLLCSSTSSVFGNAGQSDYAYANRFLDEYALLREHRRSQGLRHGRTMALNWPLWSEGGMRLEHAREAWLKEETGLSPLPSATGIEILERALEGDVCRLIVLYGQRARIEQWLHCDIHKRWLPKKDAQSLATRSPATPAPISRLKELLSDILQLPVHHLPGDVPLGELGADSLALQEYSGKISATFGVPFPVTQFFATNTLDAITEHLRDTCDWEPHGAMQGNLTEGDCEHSKRGDAVASEVQVAVIGIGGRFPRASSIDEFWSHLMGGVDLVTPVPESRWNAAEQSRVTPQLPQWGAFVPDVSGFDPAFFNMSAREAELMDPQQRLLLLCVWEALEDAAVATTALNATATGVFIGAQFSDYEQMLGWDRQVVPYASTGTARSMLANRISYLLNCTGPSEVIDTACSSSLVAVHRAVRAICTGECPLAIAGGVSLMLTPNTMLGAHRLGVLSPDGRCKTLDAAANGFVKGEGVGVVVLKPLAVAIGDRDEIYAVIRGSAVNHGGRAHSLTAPNSNAQSALLLEAYQQAGFGLDDLGLIELHGTGTALGDPVEIEGIKAALQAQRQQRVGRTQSQPSCAIGCVKTNIGHLEPAAGIAGLIKICLAVSRSELPGNLHLRSLNPLIELSNTPFYPLTETLPWPVVRDPTGHTQLRRAGVSSFGFGGVNAHVVIEQHRRPMDELPAPIGPVIIVLSAKNTVALRQRAEQLLTWIGNKFATSTAVDDRIAEEMLDLHSIAYTLQLGREAMRERLALVTNSVRSLRAQLDSWLAGTEDVSGVCYRGHCDIQSSSIVSFAADVPLTELAAKWVSGAAVHWASLYEGLRVRRLRLPTYPFRLSAHWLQEQDHKVNLDLPASDFPAAKRNGVVEPSATEYCVQLLAVSDDPLLFICPLTAEDRFLQDHEVRGARVLPAVLHLEIVLAAVERIMAVRVEAQPICFADVIFVSPVIVVEAMQLCVVLKQRNEREFTYQIRSYGEVAEVLFSQGSITVGAAAPSARAVQLDILRRRCHDTVLAAEQCYAAFSQAGLRYGQMFQTLQRVASGEDPQSRPLLLADLELPQFGLEHRFRLEPGIVDGALQAMIGMSADRAVGNRSPLLPFSIEKVELWRPLPRHARAIVHPSGTRTDGTAQCDIEITSEAGDVCVTLVGCASRPIAENKTGQQTVLFIPRWIQRALSMTPASHCDGHWVIWCLPDAPVGIVQRTMPHLRCTCLTSASRSLGARYRDYALQLLDQVSALLRLHGTTTTFVQLIVPASGELAPLRALGALLRTASNESSKLHVQVVGIEPQLDAVAVGDIIRSESRASEREVRYLNGIREVLQLEQISAQNPRSRTPWKHGGVYLVTGGAGALGTAFAESIAAQASEVKLILAGRSDASVAEASLQRLATLGARAQYRRVDVSDAAAVAALVKAIVAEYGALDGVLHCAGVLRDSLIVNKRAAELEAVFASKVDGVVALDQATQSLALDVFMVCSSVASLEGSPGQADYAAANAFMDAYMQQRAALVRAGQRHGRSVAINWPLWTQGAMRIDISAERSQRAAFGIVPLPTELGVDLLQAALELEQPQVLVLSGNRQEIHMALQERAWLGLSRPEPVPHSGPSESGDIRLEVQAAIVELFREHLCVPASQIDVNTEFGDFGLDSIGFVSLSNQLNERYGLRLTPMSFYEHVTIKNLVAFLLQEFGPELARRFTRSAHLPSLPAVPSMTSTSVPKGAGLAPTAESIAIIGISGCFPGAPSKEALWECLLGERDCIAEMPLTRWAEDVTLRRVGLIDVTQYFDPLFFGISPREAQAMDPQQRLLMMYVWHALEDAGYSGHSLSGSRTAIYVGTGNSGYGNLSLGGHRSVEGYSAAAMVGSMGPNRMSYFLDLHGPSEPIETACSSSLVAIHKGVLGLHSGECDMAIVGGVNTLIAPELQVSFTKAGMLSVDGRCKTFSAHADGYVRSEGVGMLVLKRLADARKDRDHIYGLIIGSAQNHGGRASSLTAPNPRAQADLIKQAFRQAGVSPDTVNYIEAHGTGTELGDPIEVQGLKMAFREFGGADGLPANSCGIGSIKSNIGHLELAAGVAGVIKVLLQMKHQTLVKSLHCETLNPHIKLQDSPFYIVREQQPWQRSYDAQHRELPYRAGVSSFGFGGVNAHIILEEYRSELPRPTAPMQLPVIIVLSAKNADRLAERAQQLLLEIEAGYVSADDLLDVAYTLQIGREPMEHRWACVVSSLQELQASLQQFSSVDAPGKSSYQGESRKYKEITELLGEDEDLHALVARWLASGKQARVAQLWARGLHVDWGRLYEVGGPYANSSGRRISLPSYPFARERYWVEPARLEASESIQAEPRRYPRVNANTSTLLESPVAAVVDAGVGEQQLVPVWEVVRGLASEHHWPKVGERIVMLGGSEQQQAALRSRYGQFRVLSAVSGASIEELVNELAAVGGVEHVLWVAPVESSGATQESLIESQSQGVVSCYRLLKALLALGYGSKALGVTLVTTQTQAVGEGVVEPAHASVHGFAGTISQECEQWRIRLLDVAAGEEWPLESMLAMPADRPARVYAYREGQWYEQQFVSYAGGESSGSAYRHAGVYVMIGGAGRLGEVLSEYLLSRYQAQVIWIGRREQDGELSGRLSRLSRLGGSVEYVQADAQSRAELQRAYERIKQRYGRIDGLVHAPLVLVGGELKDLGEERFAQVLYSKVATAVRLAQVFGGERLDFVLFYSSIQSYEKVGRQSAYAAGCTFVDEYAKRLQREWGCAVKVMNWGYWREGVGGSFEHWLEEAGYDCIEGPAGMSALEALLSNPVGQMVFVKTRTAQALRVIKATPEQLILLS